MTVFLLADPSAEGHGFGDFRLKGQGLLLGAGHWTLLGAKIYFPCSAYTYSLVLLAVVFFYPSFLVQGFLRYAVLSR